jgi:hypothetical protein
VHCSEKCSCTKDKGGHEGKAAGLDRHSRTRSFASDRVGSVTSSLEAFFVEEVGAASGGDSLEDIGLTLEKCRGG